MAIWVWMIIISGIVFIYNLEGFLRPRKKKPRPPGPRGLPIFGHFHLMGKNIHQDFHRLAQKYGPILRLNFGCVPAIVVSSPAAAELFLKTHDLVFCDRPPHLAFHYLSYGQKNLVFARYGPYWRNIRKLCTLELLSNHKIQQFQPMRKSEIGILVNSVKSAAQMREAVDMSLKLVAFNADITCLMVFGKKFEDRDLSERDFKAVVEKTMVEAAAFNLEDYFPFLARFDIHGSIRRLKNLSKIFDGFLEKIINDHVRDKTKKKDKMDFVYTMMEIMESGEAGYKLDRCHVKAVLLDMLLAGVDTSATAVEWALSEVIRHPRVMKKLQEELKEVVGMSQMVQESHLERLEYLGWVVKEALRLHPPGTVFIHHSLEDCEVDGFHIPKNARIFINAWSIGRDPNVWTEPEKFVPERFAGSTLDVRGRDFQLIPFGSGRRGCPGMQLGLTVVQLMLAQLVHCFDWELANGALPEELDMEEVFGIVTCRANHLIAIPTYRLHD